MAVRIRLARGGAKKLAETLKVKFLGEVPISSRVRYGGDIGRPIVIGAPQSEHAKIFMEAAQLVAGGQQACRLLRRRGRV